ncbi:MAG: glycosyltransferase family 39 protein, partial [Chloroflexota bacterium]
MRFFDSISQSRTFQRWGVPLIVFLVALFPRAIYPVSRTGEWFERSFAFAQAILNLDPAGTYLRYHPGVSLMWLSAPSLRFAADRLGLSPDQVLEQAQLRPGDMDTLITSGVLPLALVISACIAIVYPLLTRLAGRRVAISAALLMALDPFLIAYSKVIHLDALLAMFMIVSALFLLNYLKDGHRHQLILSGLFAGLAFLCKSPSLFLIPYAILMVGAVTFGRALQAGPRRSIGDWAKVVWQIGRPLLLWAIVATVTFFALFPAMWVMPGEILADIYNSIFQHVSEPHKNPVFFAGRLWAGQDPGPSFYAAVIGWKTTIVTLPLIVISLVAGIRHYQSTRARLLAAMICYALFFTLQMGIGDKKQMNYIMPVFPALAIVAALGLVWFVEAVAAWRKWQPGQWQPLALIGLIIALQAVLSLRHHPYYGTHHNLLLGGSRTAVKMLPLQDQGEGLDLAARFLNDLPYGEMATASVFHRSAAVFDRSFNGITRVGYFPDSDFRVYDLNAELRDYLGEEIWLQGWRSEQQQDLLYTVEFDGVPYVWVYGQAPADPVGDGPRYDVDYRLGNFINLESYALSDDSFRPGDELIVAYEWLIEGPVDGHYKVFNHLTAADGT